jgi:hypothetical protein
VLDHPVNMHMDGKIITFFITATILLKSDNNNVGYFCFIWLFYEMHGFICYIATSHKSC